jgi:uncharacterized membrane protein
MRLELIHPMIVHFPLALLLVGVFVKCIAFFARRTLVYPYLAASSWLIVGLGVCFAWAAIIAGEVAEDIVRKTLCQPDVLQDHRQLAYTAAIVFTAAFVVDLGKTAGKKYFSPLFNKTLWGASFLLFFAGTCILVSAAYLGGSLVYEQGAAVEKTCEKK